MLFALGQPLAALGLVLAFLAGLASRATAQAILARRLTGSTRAGSVLPHPRRDIDPFGAVGAVFGGTGWGRPAPVPPSPALRPDRRGRRAVVHLAGILLPVVLGEIVLAVLSVAPGGTDFAAFRPSDVLHGVPGRPVTQLVLSLGVGLICFGIFQIIPLPPCDGWSLLWLLVTRPGQGAAKVRFWLEDKNIGVVILLALELPLGLGGSLVHPLLDLLGTLLVRLWA